MAIQKQASDTGLDDDIAIFIAFSLGKVYLPQFVGLDR